MNQLTFNPVDMVIQA